MSDSATTAAGLGERPRDEERASKRSSERSPGRIRNIGTFYRQVVAELRKVIWPTRKELITYTTVVVVFVLVMTAIIGVFDLVFGKGVLAIFGE